MRSRVILQEQVGQEPLLLVGLRDADPAEVHPSGKKRSCGRTGAVSLSVSRFCPAQAMLPCRVATTERARSYVNAAAWPPAEPTERRVTAGDAVGVVASA